MLQRKVPDRKSLEFCISGMDPSLVFLIKLGEAGGHLPTAGARSGDDDKRPGGLDIVVFSISVFTDDQGDIGRISVDIVVQIDLDAQVLQVTFEHQGPFLAGQLCDDYAAHIKRCV